MASILHVSDVHFGPKHVAELSRAVLDLARCAGPSVVVVSGDLTQRAKPRQFREARAWIDALPAPVVLVPGNHDVPMYRFWERLLSPFGAWRRHFSPELVRDQILPELAVVGLNTAFAWTTKHGRVSRREVAELERRLTALPESTPRVLVAHHPLAGGVELAGEPTARGAEAALALCRRSGIGLVLAGHLHRGFWLPSPDGPGGPGPLVAHAGTATSTRGRGGERGRQSLQWIEVGARGELRIERRFWNRKRGEFVTEAVHERATRP